MHSSSGSDMSTLGVGLVPNHADESDPSTPPKLGFISFRVFRFHFIDCEPFGVRKA